MTGETAPHGEGGGCGAIRCAWLIDGSGAAPLHDRVLRWRDGRILAILEPAAAAAQGIEALDYSRGGLLPGLIDAHVHLALAGDPDPVLREAQLTAGDASPAGRIACHLEDHCAAGVVAVRDGGDRGGLTLSLRERCAAAGRVVLRASGPAWYRAGRYGAFVGRPVADGETLAAAIDCIGRQAPTHRPDHIKILNSGLNSLQHYGTETAPQFSLAEMKAAVDTAARFGLGTMVHANGREPVAIALAAGCRSIEHGYFMGPENLARLADTGVAWLPTVAPMAALAAALPAGSQEAAVARRTLEGQLDQISRARGLGIRLVLGTDAGSRGVLHGHALRAELRLFLDAGMRREEALYCAGGAAADLLGIGDLGVLAPGRRACFIAVPGPLSALPESLGRIGMVVADGRVARAATGDR